MLSVSLPSLGLRLPIWDQKLLASMISKSLCSCNTLSFYVFFMTELEEEISLILGSITILNFER